LGNTLGVDKKPIMKIAHVVTLKESVPPQSQNGLEFLVSWLADGLVQKGHDVTLFGPADSQTKAKLISLVPKGTNNDETGWGQPYFSIWNTIQAGALANQFDIIHCHDFFGSHIAPFIKTPIIQTIHHAYRDEFLPKYIQSEPYRTMLQFVIDQYAKINYVPISKSQERYFKQSESTYFKKSHLIYNGIPLETFSYNDTPQEYLFYIGYINKDKGADVAVQVAKKLNKKLILAGNNFGQEVFFNEHIKPYLNDDIRYVGPVTFEQKNELYKNAYATLAPLAWDEPFGLTLVESQACGTPVIAFNKGAAAEIIKNGTTGFVVETMDEMCQAVEKVKKLSRKACREWVQSRFSVERMVDEYEKLYKSILETKQ
jgi:glycosyltransferase involved in cell wall biosynthesis